MLEKILIFAHGKLVSVGPVKGKSDWVYLFSCEIVAKLFLNDI